MYVCVCNALTEAMVKARLAEGATRPADLYAACGCRAQCGSCVRMILKLLRDSTATAPTAAAAKP
jgi:bacterioferritin-associated ferredoxin